MYPTLNNIKKIKLQPTISAVYVNDAGAYDHFNVNETGIEILLLCNGINSREEIIEILSQKYNEDYAIVSEFVDEFIQYSIKLNNITLNEKPMASALKIPQIGSKEFWTPYVLCIELTYMCPLKCKHCYLDAGKGDSIDRLLLNRIVNEAIELGVDSIQLTGGEPLLYDGIFDAMEQILSNDIEVQLFTSGVINSDQIIKKFKLLKHDKLSIQVSIDGLEEYHNDFRGVNNCFKESIEFIKSMIGIGIKVSVATSIIEQSFEEIESLCSLIKELGVDMYRLSATSERGRAKENGIETTASRVVNTKEMKRKLSEKYNSDQFIVINDEEDILQTTSSDSFKNCGMGYNILKVSPNGDVYPCVISDIIIGNIKTKTLSDFLKDNCFKFINLERPNKKYCNDCDFEELCGACIMEGLLYCKKNTECMWYKEQKDILQKLL